MNIVVDFFIWLWDKIPRIIRKIFVLCIGIAALPFFPYGGLRVGHSIQDFNTRAGRPLDRQYDWPTYLFWTGVVIGAVIFLLSILYLFSKKRKKRGLYD